MVLAQWCHEIGIPLASVHDLSVASLSINLLHGFLASINCRLPGAIRQEFFFFCILFFWETYVFNFSCISLFSVNIGHNMEAEISRRYSSKSPLAFSKCLVLKLYISDPHKTFFFFWGGGGAELFEVTIFLYINIYFYRGLQHAWAY